MATLEQPASPRPCVTVRPTLLHDARVRAWLDQHACQISPCDQQRLEIVFPDATAQLEFVLRWAEHQHN